MTKMGKCMKLESLVLQEKQYLATGTHKNPAFFTVLTTDTLMTARKAGYRRLFTAAQSASLLGEI